MSLPQPVEGTLLPLLRQMCSGPYGIAVGGSHAKGSSDALSDVDLYLFAYRVLPGAHRSSLITEAFGERVHAASWGQDAPFVEGGTDFLYEGQRVECWLRNAEQVESAIAACKRGEIRREYSIWAVTGFFNYVVLADVQAMRIVEDPYGLLARWKADVSTYPEALRQAILRRFMREAAFWPENFHYQSAIARADIIYTTAIVQQVMQALVQVIFALNREYFPGEKKLSGSIGKLSVQPQAFAARLEALLLSLGKDVSEAQFEEQQQAMGALVADTKELVLADGGMGS